METYLRFLHMNLKYQCLCVSVVCNGVKETIITLSKWNHLPLSENLEIKHPRADSKQQFINPYWVLSHSKPCFFFVKDAGTKCIDMNYDMQNSLIIDGVYQRGKHRSSGWTIILIPGFTTEKNWHPQHIGNGSRRRNRRCNNTG